MKHAQDDERGFILVTSLILLSILTILGAMSFFKSNIEIKVSRGSMEAEQAFAAMNAGLSITYANWSAAPGGEFKSLGDWVGSKTGSAPAIYVNSYPTTAAGINGAAPAGARTYTLLADGTLGTGVAWGTGNDPQVAIWVTSFAEPSGTDYPYVVVPSNHVTSGGTACSTCALVVYALGRSGDARRLGREYMSTVTQNITAYGAMINAPKYANDTDRCAGTTSTASSTTTTTSTNIQGSHLIDSTQAPGGTAIASNNGFDFPNTSKQWKSSNDFGTGSSAKDIDPYVVFDPGKVTALTEDYPEISGGQISSVSASVLSADMFASNYMDYFNSVNDQLFQLDAYREAANRIAGFYTETLANGDTVVTGTGTASTTTTLGSPRLGNYDALKTANGGKARMGTIQWPDVRYNIDNSIPMYGIVRLMMPVTLGSAQVGNGTGCPVGSNAPAKFDVPGANDPIAAANGKLIVYGGALFDFFYDGDTSIDGTNVANDLYEPSKERLVSPLEARSFKVNVDSPLMFNPVMDDVGGATSGPRTGATSCADLTVISCYPNGSPSWDLISDELSGGDGVMDLIGDVDHVARNWSGMVHNGTSFPLFSNGYSDWMVGEPAALGSTAWGSAGVASVADLKALLDYYIQTTAHGVKADWSHKTLTAIEGNYEDFKIQTQSDLVDSYSAADLYHSFLPSGYIHGWKRAMMETGLAAESGATGKSIWNEELLGAGSTYYAKRNTYFNLNGYGNTAKVDKTFADIPAEMYAGGLVDMHQIVNTSGVVYTPGQLELEQKIQNGFQALQYINGVVITGHGTFFKQESGAPNALTIIAYDDTSIDNLPTKNATVATGRRYWQELK